VGVSEGCWNPGYTGAACTHAAGVFKKRQAGRKARCTTTLCVFPLLQRPHMCGCQIAQMCRTEQALAGLNKY